MPQQTKSSCASRVKTATKHPYCVAQLRHGLFCLFLLLVAQPAHPAISARHTAHLCDLAARSAAASQDVPYDVLRAISRVETGRSRDEGLEPWPWTVNMEGAGKWFASEDDARAYVFKHFKRGARSFDVGCFQINYKWHGAAFRSIDDMFDPELNADYAASFLRDLYDELGDWTSAAGAYHSRTPTFAKSYAARFENVHGNIKLGSDNLDLPEGGPLDPDNSGGSGLFAVRLRAPLVGTGTARMGSLVPMMQQADPGNQAFVVMN